MILRIKRYLLALIFCISAVSFASPPENAEYYLARWEWVTEDGMSYWRAPAGTIGLVDLRPLSGGDHWGFFATTTTLGGDALYLGTDLYGPLQPGAKTAWESRLGLVSGSISSNTVCDVLAETLTEDADSSGTNRALPLLPTHLGQLEIHLGGHSLVWSRRFDGLTDRGWPKIQAVLWHTYRQVRAEAARIIILINGITLADLQRCGDPSNPERDRLIRAALALKTPSRTWADVKAIIAEAIKKHARKYLGAQVRKYRVDWRELVPPDLQDWGMEAPTTTISDNFDRANQSGLGTSGEGWSWLVTNGSWSISSNTALSGSGGCYVRAEYDLSSDDHFAQAAVGGSGAGMLVRYSASAVTYYYARNNGTTDNVFKVLSDTATSIGSFSATRTSATVKLSADGSSIIGIWDGAATISITDTAIAGYVRTGMRSASSRNYDDFAAADLVAAPASALPALYYQRMMGAN